MTACPFCHAEVDEDLIRFGGTCSKCFAEIPGEEAPTDPGEEARRAQHAEDRKAAGVGRLVPLLAVAVALLGVLGYAVYVVTRPQPVVAVLDFDDGTYALAEIELVAYTEPEAPPAGEAVARATPRRSIRDLKVDVGSDEGDVGDVSGPTATGPRARPTARPEAPTDAVVDAAPVDPSRDAAPATLFPGIDIGIARRGTKGVRLTDDSAIIEMIRGVLEAELPRLKSCYETRLKVRDDLAGRWMLSLVVSRDGEPSRVAVNAQGTADEELERCVAAKVEKWAFQPIRADQPVQKTLTFRPGF